MSEILEEFKVKFTIIALNTFRETMRDRILRVIVGVSIFVIVISKIIGELSIGQDLKILVDFSLGTIDIFGVVLCIFIGASLIQREIDKKTLYTILSCPMNRWEFIFGKYLGMCMTLFVSTFVMGIFFCSYYFLMGGQVSLDLVGCIVMLFMGLMVLNSVAILLSVLTSSSVSIIVTAITFFIGRSTYHLKAIPQFSDSATLNYLTNIMYYILPNFNNFDIKEEATHALTIPSEVYLYAFLYMVVYSSVMLYLASLAINKRNL
ncbi:ABC transporter permease subunit [Candidatus Uabimicrobium amorphum]|uniref:ABC transporter permease n=1 Tax=Uabimicrobium amorphum TaxID=2596890 RepID=UPI00125ED367|nr:ABC transporter permease subunit [Candidatus Uabimicrobium amorphum]